MDESLLTSPDYKDWLGELQARVHSARISAAAAVNRELVLLYWDIGQGIVEKQEQFGWGDGAIDQLASDLRHAFPRVRGFSKQNVWRMRQLYLACSSPAFLSQAVRELQGSFLCARELGEAIRLPAKQTKQGRSF